MRRITAFILTLVLAMCAIPALGDGAGGFVSASTPLDGAGKAMLDNIELAASAIDGLYLPYGDYFSFNDEVGPRTRDAGYATAKNGRGSKVVGGGVSQVATTLYLALQELSGIEYDDISVYGEKFTGDYVDDGEMAIVTDYSRGTDFAFTNYAGDLVISMWTEDEELICSISGGGSNSHADPENMLLISSAAIDLDGSDGLISNITRAADSIGWYTLEDGEIFSFNDTVGPRTKENGYVTAINGRGVKVTGGGVAQVASVVWLAIEDLDDISIVEKSTYGKRYSQKYVDSSADAILTDYNAGTDFSFKNMRRETLYIETYVSGDELICEIFVEDQMMGIDPVEEPVLSW